MSSNLAESLEQASASALEVLDRFTQRHRNQHRVAKWWSQVGIVRRALRRLLEALVAQETHLASARKNPGSRTKTSARNAAAADHHRESVLARATWLCDHVLPQAYISFTQVAADKQHAALGLFLVGLLAFLQQSLRPLVPESQPVEPTGPAPLDPGLAADDEVDLGVAIPRAMFDSNMPSPRPVKEELMKPKKESKPAKAAVTPPPIVTAPAKRKQTSEAKPKEVKTKRKKKGDEFANLFGSLL
ncbi:hypothetical protein B0T11DRAFT_332589 [Plectosphaerella cucumerina]|uniref:RNase MRP protein 1 RNA binding domain-containing protein n=1 Tax=Plectosphaerella cucumerina TaxID=40658 RepID=A0A8K0WYJ7_9PEZI|nr:hypothetical protein B0T11DRAFT_332589 [Plectosphaerella cucumerina]